MAGSFFQNHLGASIRVKHKTKMLSALGRTVSLYKIRQHGLNIAFVNFLNGGFGAQSPFLFCLLFGQDVILESSLAFDLSGSGYLKPFLGS